MGKEERNEKIDKNVFVGEDKPGHAMIDAPPIKLDEKPLTKSSELASNLPDKQPAKPKVEVVVVKPVLAKESPAPTLDRPIVTSPNGQHAMSSKRRSVRKYFG